MQAIQKQRNTQMMRNLAANQRAAMKAKRSGAGGAATTSPTEAPKPDKDRTAPPDK